MRRIIIGTALIAAAALALAGCKRQATVTNVSTNDLSANMMTTAPANDASAMETVTNSSRAPAPPPVTGNSAANVSSSAPPRTNNVESNTLGM